MPRKPQFSRYKISIHDNIEGVTKTIERCVREGQGRKHFGTFSYKGERLELIMGAGCHYPYNEFTSENYPPSDYRCKTKAAKAYWEQLPY